MQGHVTYSLNSLKLAICICMYIYIYTVGGCGGGPFCFFGVHLLQIGCIIGSLLSEITICVSRNLEVVLMYTMDGGNLAPPYPPHTLGVTVLWASYVAPDFLCRGPPQICHAHCDDSPQLNSA